MTGFAAGGDVLREEIFGIYLGVKSGSRSAVEVSNGARYRMLFLKTFL